MLRTILKSLSALFGSKKAPNIPKRNFGTGRITEPEDLREELVGVAGALSARTALETVQPLAVKYDPDARLIQVLSGPDLTVAGRSHEWSFHYLFPDRWARAEFRVVTAPKGTARNPRTDYFWTCVTPFPPPGSALQGMLAEGREGFVKQQWEVELGKSIPLPTGFRDSSEAVEEFSRQGTDLRRLPEGTRLEGIGLPLGELVWRLTDLDPGKKSKVQAPFS
ncbi:MAG: hypothetical protein HY319_09960 [Armatimonadetes bacterium]|nr:hypothetical protein [Armatimonadota bacterium]